MNRPTHFGGVLILALLIGSFLFSSIPAQAASLRTIIYQRALPAEMLANVVPATIAVVPFRAEKRGTFSLTSFQKANIGVPAGGNFSQWQTIMVHVSLDGLTIYTTTIGSFIRGPQLTQIGITVHHGISRGRHILTLVYISTPYGHLNGCANFNYPLNCETPYLYSGNLFVKVIA